MATEIREPWFLKFHDLMPFMAREVLLVSSAYDAFILEEDGRLDERLFTAYSELSLHSIPRLTHVSTASRALELLAERRFDLVITVVRLEDTDAVSLSRMVKERHPALPVVLLAFDEADMKNLPQGERPATIDGIFLWTGNAQILIAAIKLIEDARNIEHDVRTAGVQVLIVVEDSLRRYSTFLGLLYSELMSQSRSLIAEGLNALHRLMRMRARPKILLATSFEEAVDHFRRYQESVMAVISDLRFPRGGVEDPEAGFALARLIRDESRDVPILLQSAEQDAEPKARDLGASFANKNAPTLMADIRSFLKEAVGFGDFVFRLPDRTEVGRAKDLYELERVLRTVPIESVEYHASRNHFSMWLNARGMFLRSQQLRPRKIGEFRSIEELRQYLIDVLRQEFTQEQEGVMADFSPLRPGPGRAFVRLGKGSVGGKGRGIAFVNSMLARHALPDRFPGLDIRVPKTIVLGTDEFEQYLELNGITFAGLQGATDQEIVQRFLAGRLSERLVRDLELSWKELQGPVAVRSSSLLEDSRFQPFAGIYATCMLPNNHADAATRFLELRQAIKAVYASTFHHDAQSYFAGTPHTVEEERMAVVIQEMVGQDYGDRFYPHISGVAQSHNYYPVGHQRAEDGIALIALGLGHGVVSGGPSLRFSPSSPAVLPQFATARDFLRFSQTKFYALDMTRQKLDFAAGPESSLVICDLTEAEKDGSLALVGSVYCTSDDVIRDNLSLPGPRVLTFHNILKWNAIPLASALEVLLRTFRQGLGGDVEIEIAVDLGSTGRPSSWRGTFVKPCLYVLQVRPMATLTFLSDVREAEETPRERVLCRTGRSLGHGKIADIRDVVYVRRIELDGTTTPTVAAQIGRINRKLVDEKIPYLLIGPGRWGSADPALGIPVEWSQIAGARVIVETSFDSRSVEPSQGTHFFQNITFLRLGYLTVSRQRRQSGEELIDMEWLDRQPAVDEAAAVRHVRLPSPLLVYLDGRQGRATILKPAAEGASP